MEVLIGMQLAGVPLPAKCQDAVSKVRRPPHFRVVPAAVEGVVPHFYSAAAFLLTFCCFLAFTDSGCCSCGRSCGWFEQLILRRLWQIGLAVGAASPACSLVFFWQCLMPARCGDLLVKLGKCCLTIMLALLHVVPSGSAGAPSKILTPAAGCTARMPHKARLGGAGQAAGDAQQQSI